MRAPLLLAVSAAALAACANTSPAGGSGAGFEPTQLAKSDIDRVADAYHREIVADLRALTAKFYRRNPKEWKKSGATDLDAAVARIFDPSSKGDGHGHYAELGGRSGTDAMVLAFREDYQGDRVLALMGGLAGMISSAFNDKQEFFMTDELDPQKFYNSARNVEIALWRLAQKRDSTGALFLLSNEAAVPQNLSFEREFGKVIGHLDLLSKIAADKTNRTIVKVLQTLATAVFLPVAVLP
jgi:hypothetical protein